MRSHDVCGRYARAEVNSGAEPLEIICRRLPAELSRDIHAGAATPRRSARVTGRTCANLGNIETLDRFGSLAELFEGLASAPPVHAAPAG
jgi:hypothetical protein